MVEPKLIDIKSSSTAEEDSEDESEVLEESPCGRWLKRREQVEQRDIPGIEATYLAMDTEEGVEVVWNEVRFSERKYFNAREEKISQIFNRLIQLDHPNIVKLHKYWMDKDVDKPRVIFITEYNSSGSLKQFLKKTKRNQIKMALPAWKRWCTQILSALCYLHSSQPPIIHANLTCDTIFLSHNGLIKIGAVAPDAIHRHIKTVREQAMANLYFVAPELGEITGETSSALTPAVDIYSFGMCALEMAALEISNNSENGSSSAQVTEEAINRTIDSLENPLQADFIRQCLRKNPLERPTSKQLLFHSVIFEVPCCPGTTINGCDGPMVIMDIDKTLILMEKSRQESVQEKVQEKVKKFEQFNETLMEEFEQELKLIRHRHLVATLKRLKFYKEEYDELVVGINRHENEMELKGRSYQDKLNEIERTIKQAVEDAKKATSHPIDEVNSTVNVNSNVDVVPKVEDDNQKSDVPIATDSITDEKITSTGESSLNDLNGSAEVETFSEYVQLQRFCIDYENSLQNFNNDTKFKSYRNDLKLFIRTLINTVAKNSVEDLRHKANQLNRLFSKQSVNYQNSHLDCNSHPDAVNFCFSFAAQTFVAAVVKQASSGTPAATAFPIGAFIGMIWSRYPTFGKLFLGLLQEKCPFVIPYYPKRENGESEMNHLITSGYCISKDGTLEPEESYIKRMKAMIIIYGIIIQSNIKNHPRGLKYGWNWLANILRLPPQPLITAGILHAFLQTTSFKLFNIYGSQFLKILDFLETFYIPMIARSTGKEVTRQTLVSLEVYVKESIYKIRKSRRLDEPLGLIRVIPENI